MAPPKGFGQKYFSEQERDEAQRVYSRASRLRRKHGQRLRIIGHVETATDRPPPEVLAEREHRYALMANQTVTAQMLAEPPAPYATKYYVKAWRVQRAYARGQM